MFAPTEERIREALTRFTAEQGARPITHRRLFADDAAQGLGLLATAQINFDVIIMNPPFGSSTTRGQAYIDSAYPDARFDILAAFVSRARELAPQGAVGAITNRTCLFIASLGDWRRRVLLDQGGLSLLVDLGHGVLDSALVEAASYVLAPGLRAIATSTLSDERKDIALLQRVSAVSTWYAIDKERLSALGNGAIAYWAPPEVLASLLEAQTCEKAGFLPRVGLQTSDDFRFLRLQWEVPRGLVGEGRWVPFAKGGEYSPFADNLHLAVKWFDRAAEQRAFALAHADRTGSARGNDATREFEWYYREGLTYSERTTSDISVRVLPRGCITGTSGPGIFSHDPQALLPALAFFSTAVFRQLLELSIGSGDAVASGSAARHYTVGNLGRCPLPAWTDETYEALRLAAQRCVCATRSLLASSPTASGPVRNYPVYRWAGSPLNDVADKESMRRLELVGQLLTSTGLIEAEVAKSFGLESGMRDFVNANTPMHPCRRPLRVLDPSKVCEFLSNDEDALVDKVSTECGFSRAVSKKAWYADRRIELACLFFDAHPSSVIRAAFVGGARGYPGWKSGQRRKARCV